MKDAIKGIETTTQGISFETFASSWMIQRAVERGLEIISEATRHVPPELLFSQPQIDWPAIRAIGNQLRHAYHHIEPTVVWDIVSADMAPLKAAVSAMIDTVRQP
ncbi:MAG: HepT-like ribonuclease domain-containing protein [Beijerinckiaceae bacterium]